MKFHYVPKSKMRLSKSIIDERVSLDWIIIWFYWFNFCVILSLALQLDHDKFYRNKYKNPMLFSVSKRKVKTL